MMTLPKNLESEINTFQKWINDLEQESSIIGANDAYAALRSVLQTLRDRMTPEEAAHLSSQLPLIARGIYYEGMRPDTMPKKFDKESFMAQVRKRLNGKCENVSSEHLVKQVFQVMSSHIEAGQISHIQAMLPKDLEDIWPESVAA